MSNRPWQRWRPLDRRTLLRALTGASLAARCPWLPAVARAAERTDYRCIVLWMAGGPSQLDTFDPKPGHPNGGPLSAIATRLPGVAFTELLPQLARRADALAVVRSMHTREGDHGRATVAMHTGQRPGGPLERPVLGAVVAQQLPVRAEGLPAFVSITPPAVSVREMTEPGFLGPQFAPLVVAADQSSASDSSDPPRLRVENLQPATPLAPETWSRRKRLWEAFETAFAQSHHGDVVAAHRAAYRAAMRLMESEARRAFAIDEEPDAVHRRYGTNTFGQGCLLARRLAERGVRFVEVAMNGLQPDSVLGWDTHQQNFARLPDLCAALDSGFAALIDDLRDRGLWDSTLIVWAGEFGRTPKINAMAGRDHFPAAWTVVLSGGRVRTGQVVGKTADDGSSVLERPVSAGQLLATIYRALGIDPHAELLAPIGRPIPLVERDVAPLPELLVAKA